MVKKVIVSLKRKLKLATVNPEVPEIVIVDRNEEFKALLDQIESRPAFNVGDDDAKLWKEQQDLFLTQLCTFVSQPNQTFDPNYINKDRQNALQILLINGFFTEAGTLIQMPNFQVKYQVFASNSGHRHTGNNNAIPTMKEIHNFPEDQHAIKLDEQTDFLIKARNRGFDIHIRELFGNKTNYGDQYYSSGYDLHLYHHPTKSEQIRTCSSCLIEIEKGEIYFGNICFHAKHMSSNRRNRYGHLHFAKSKPTECAMHFDCAIHFLSVIMRDFSSKNVLDHSVPKCPHNKNAEISPTFLTSLYTFLTSSFTIKELIDVSGKKITDLNIFSMMGQKIGMFILQENNFKMYRQTLQQLSKLSIRDINDVYKQNLFMNHPDKVTCPKLDCSGFVLIHPDEEMVSRCPVRPHKVSLDVI